MHVSRLVIVGAALAAAIGCKPKPDTREEERLRDEHARAFALDAGQLGAKLANTSDIHYEWGFTDVRYDPAYDYHGKAFRWIGQRAFLRLRSHGAKPMRFRIQGWADQKQLHNTPNISVYVNGHLHVSSTIDPSNGGWGVEGTVPASMLADAEWVGMTLELSSVSWHWLDVPDLVVAFVGVLEWEEATPP